MEFLTAQTCYFNSLKLKISNLNTNPESKEYEACSYAIHNQIIISRKSKITPKKIGQFVTIWKRDVNGITAPYSSTDSFDYFAISCHSDEQSGVFIFPKAILIEKGIISSIKKEGKRGIRVYPSWDKPNNKTSIKTQKWQLNYFTLLPFSANEKQRTTQLFN